ncbi:MAG TPA: HAMP domain-containing sensor histidine kinase [Acidimicrobiia bacterium]
MKSVLAAIGVAVAAVLVAEIIMQPSGADRVTLILVFGVVSLVTTLIGLGLRSLRFRSLHGAVLVVALASVGASVLAVAISAGLMFISGHDLRLVIVALGLGIGLGIVTAATVSRPLARDIRALGEAARRVGSGDLGARVGVRRSDELGEAARAFDSMVEALGAADEEKRALDRSRREFLASVSHDLRTPLASLQAAAEALQDGLVEDPERYLRVMEIDLRALRVLVDDLFLMALLEAGEFSFEPVRVDLAEIVDEAAEAMTPVADLKNVQVVLRSEGLAMVVGSPDYLGRAVRNLLDNAIRYAPAQSRVEVVVTSESSRVNVAVTDSGPGFPEGWTIRALEPFTKADRARREAGSGLGLAIAAGIARAHNGHLRIADGPGAQVLLTVPSA